LIDLAHETPFYLRRLHRPFKLTKGNKMKHKRIPWAAVAALIVGSIVIPASAETVTTTTSYSGTVTEYSPDGIVVRSETSSTPVRYTYTKTTSYLDEQGRPVSIKTVKSGQPVTVYYTAQGDKMIASKVILRSTASTISPVASSTEYMGTVSAINPDTIVVRAEGSATPMTYAYTKTTTYVDEDGDPVSVETIQSGAPVTVYYTQDGDRLVASKVIVRRTVTSIPDDDLP
jgi:hypothetical protein